MISVITPVHKELPWWNIRLLAMCMQTYKDWEWILLDNSKDGFVKDYVDNFFNNLQGQRFPECRNKFKIFRELFEGVEVEHGRIGKLKNRCVELSSAKDDDIIVVLDYDDFINTRSLEYINNAIRETGADFCRMDIITESYQNLEDGSFNKHTTSDYWCTLNRLDLYRKCPDFINAYDTDKALKNYIDTSDIRNTYMANLPCSFNYGIFRFDYDRTRKHNTGINLLEEAGDHFVGTRKAFEKCGGFFTEGPVEDVPLLYKVATECKIVYVSYPWLSIIHIIENNNTCIVSNSVNAAKYAERRNDEKYIETINDLFIERYKKFGINNIETIKYDLNKKENISELYLNELYV